MMERLFNYLLSKGIDVYFVGQHQGECTSKFLVIKDDGTDGNSRKNGRRFIDLLFFVPIDKYLECEKFKTEVKSLLKDYKSIRYTGNETSIVPTEKEKKAYTFSVMYEAYQKLEG